MALNPQSVFREIVSQATELPNWVSAHVGEAHGVETQGLDQSYLDFLDDMIAREPRGPDWTQVSKKRRKALESVVGKTLLSGFVLYNSQDYFVKVDPDPHRILYWETNDIQNGSEPSQSQ